MTKTMSGQFMKLGAAWTALQAIALFALVSPSHAADEDVAAGRLDKSFPEVRPADTRSELKPHVGLMAGYNDLRGPVAGSPVGTVDVGFQPVIPFSIGVQFAHAPSEIEIGTTEQDFKTTNLLAKAAYNFGGDVPIVKSTYLGVKSGATWYNAANNTNMHFAAGPVLGMDFPLGARNALTLGPEFSYLGVFGDNAPDQISASGAMKYWF